MKRNPLYLLLAFCPAAIVVGNVWPDAHVVVFALAALGIIPLAGLMGKATEHLADRTSDGLGGLLNATFGNMAELIIAVLALREGLHEIVKASITGSIIGNSLLVLGVAMLSGGVKFKTQTYNAVGARTRSTMLSLAAVALVVPAVFHHLAGPGNGPDEAHLSLGAWTWPSASRSEAAPRSPCSQHPSSCSRVMSSGHRR